MIALIMCIVLIFEKRIQGFGKFDVLNGRLICKTKHEKQLHDLLLKTGRLRRNLWLLH